jgi:hypothetical protein
MAGRQTPPWRKAPPRTAGSTKLTSAETAKARQRAKKAGRRYPNLIDNMIVARQRKERRD